MEKEKSNNQNKIPNQGYVIVPNYFLREWVKVLGGGPALLYLELLSYCHQEKDLAWPTLGRLSNLLGIAKTTLLRYLNTLIKSGLIKNITRDKSTTGHHKKNIYQILLLKRENGSKMPPGEYQKDTPYGSKTLPIRYQNETSFSSKTLPFMVANLHPNNNNLKHYQYNNNQEAEKDVVVAVDFKKLKKKGDLSACLPERGRSQSGNAQAGEKMQAIREQLIDLSFEEKFIEQILKDFSLEKIEEKLELLIAKTNIQNSSGWLLAALKNDYQGSKEEEIQEAIEEKKEEPQRKISSREEALRQIRLAKEKLALITPYYQIKGNEEKGGLPLGT
jgi:hypothetical protein